MLAISRLRLVPQNDRFFDLFNMGARNTLEGAKVLADLLDSFEDIERKARRLKDIEHSGDEITHAVLAALNRTFITPLDREDITHLASVMDDVIDWMEHVAHRVWLYRLTEVTPLAQRFGQVILEQADQIARAIPLLEDKRNSDDLQHAAREIHRLENEADDLLAEAVSTLYDGATAVPQLVQAIRWGDLYQLMEETTDKAENVASELCNIALKNA